MWGRLAFRLLGFGVTLFVTSIIIFAAVDLSPGDPATVIAGGGHVSPETLAAIRQQYHLHDPFLVRYWSWLSGAIQGNFGQSIVYHSSIASLLAPRLVNTVFLVVYSNLLILFFGVGLGVLGALRGRTIRATVTVMTAIGQAIPVFVGAIILIALFAVYLGWFPTFGSGAGFLDRLWHLTLPAIAMSVSYLAWVSQITQAAVTEELEREHVGAARSRGIPEWRVVWRHILRNAAAPITTVGGLAIAGLIAGDVIAEEAFQVNGIGAFLVTSVHKKDILVVQAICLILVSAFVITNTAVDAINTMLDPRLRKANR